MGNLSGARLVRPQLSEANLNGASLSGASLINAHLSGSMLSGANLSGAWFSEAILNGATLIGTELFGAHFTTAMLSGANLSEANLVEADLRFANLSGADLTKTRIINVKLHKATLTDCRVFGISAWGLIGLETAEQKNLVITPYGEPVITVDNLEVAQFIYLLLHSEKIRAVIDTITSNVVLILGCFKSERKVTLDAIRDKLRKRNRLPVLFDFDKPATRDTNETLTTLAHMTRFVIADITDPRSVPQELKSIVTNLPSVPVQPIILASATEYGMFDHIQNFKSVLKIFRYKDLDDLLKNLDQRNNQSLVVPLVRDIAEYIRKSNSDKILFVFPIEYFFNLGPPVRQKWGFILSFVFAILSTCLIWLLLEPSGLEYALVGIAVIAVVVVIVLLLRRK